jgi:hypothetical protein
VREIDMSIRPSSATLALTAAFGCTLQIGPDTSDSAPATDPGTTTDDSGSGGTTTAATTGESSTSTAPTTTAATTSETSGTTGEVAPEWCHGLDPDGPAALTVANEAGVDIVDGTPLQVVCGGQGSVMIPIYPHFGGFIPDVDNLGFDVILDVDGFNLGPDGHFFGSIGHQHDVNCAYQEPYYEGGYSYSFIPIFPPDAIPDLAVLDGKPGVLQVTLYSPIGDMKLEAKVVLSAIDVDCGYGGYDTDTDGTTDGTTT